MPGILTPVISITPPGVQVTGSAGSVGPSGSTAPPPVSTDRINISFPDTNWLSANRVLYKGSATAGGPSYWSVAGGDYLDSAGVFNGPSHYRSVPVTAGTPVTIDISNIDGDVRISGARITSVAIGGVNATAFWVDPTSNQGVALPGTQPSGSTRPVMVLNPTRAATMVVTPFGSGTLLVDKVAGPLIEDFVIAADEVSVTPDIWELEMIDEATINARAGGSFNVAQPFAFNPEFLVDPDTSLKYLRFSSDPNADPNNTTGAYSRLISWYLPIGGTTTREDMYCRFCLYIEADMVAGFNDVGMKLPGITNANTTTQAELISLRMLHSPPAPNNGGLVGLQTYNYSVSSGAGYGLINTSNALLRTEKWYVIEQYAKMNTPGSNDGIQQLWVNGSLVMDAHDVNYRTDPATTVANIHMNVYHGGLNAPKSVMHYRVAKIALSSARIGMPPELLPHNTSNVPAWVPPVGTIQNVSLNRLSDVDPCPGNQCSYSGNTHQGGIYNDTGVCFAPDLGTLGSLVFTGGGHQDYFGNEVYRYDLATQLWTRLTNPHAAVAATSPPLASGSKAIGYFADPLLGEQWADTTFTTTLQNQPSAGHLYGYQQVLPIGAKGSLVTLCRPGMSPFGASVGRIAHILDLDAQVTAGQGTTLWRRFTDTLNPSILPQFGGSCYDAKRNRVWATESTGTAGHLYYLDLASATWTYTSIVHGGFYGTLMRSEAMDRMIYFRRYVDGYQLKITDPNTGVIYQPTATGAIPPYDSVNSPLGGGSDWCVDLPGGEGFVYYNGGGGNDVQICQPTGDPDTAPWNFTSMTLTPATSADAPVIQLVPANCTHLHRFVYCPPIRSFLWIATAGSYVNCWRLFT